MGNESSSLYAKQHDDSNVGALAKILDAVYVEAKTMDRSIEEPDEVTSIMIDGKLRLAAWPERARLLAIFSGVRHLRLTNLGLETFPREALTLRELESLWLGGNALTALPPDFAGSFMRLGVLHLEACRLQDGTLVAARLEPLCDVLRELYLSDNELRSFLLTWPSARLEVLSLAGNARLVSFASRCALVRLKLLDLSHCGLAGPGAVRTLDRVLESELRDTQLETLLLAGLGITVRECVRLGEQFAPALRSLDLRSNPVSLDALPALAKLTALRRLDLCDTLVCEARFRDPLPAKLMPRGGTLCISGRDETPRPEIWADREDIRLEFRASSWPRAIELEPDEPPQLYLGDHESALNLLFRHGENADGSTRRSPIQRLLLINPPCSLAEHADCMHHVVRSRASNLRSHLYECVHYIENSLLAGLHVLVCASALEGCAVTVAYLVMKCGVTFPHACTRCQAHFEPAYERQLRAWIT